MPDEADLRLILDVLLILGQQGRLAPIGLWCEWTTEAARRESIERLL